MKTAIRLALVFLIAGELCHAAPAAPLSAAVVSAATKEATLGLSSFSIPGKLDDSPPLGEAVVHLNEIPSLTVAGLNKWAGTVAFLVDSKSDPGVLAVRQQKDGSFRAVSFSRGKVVASAFRLRKSDPRPENSTAYFRLVVPGLSRMFLAKVDKSGDVYATPTHAYPKDRHAVGTWMDGSTLVDFLKSQIRR